MLRHQIIEAKRIDFTKFHIVDQWQCETLGNGNTREYYNYYAICNECGEWHYINDEGFMQVNGKKYTKCYNIANHKKETKPK